MYWKTDRQKRKEFETVIAEKKAKEKNEAWIRELEARDAEEKEIRALREQRRKVMMEEREKGSVAKSMVAECEGRRKGVLEMVQDAVRSGKN